MKCYTLVTKNIVHGDNCSRCKYGRLSVESSADSLWVGMANREQRTSTHTYYVSVLGFHLRRHEGESKVWEVWVRVAVKYGNG